MSKQTGQPDDQPLPSSGNLAASGYREPERARAALLLLEQLDGTALASRALAAASATRDPDRALHAIERVLSARRPRQPERIDSRTLAAVGALGVGSDFLVRTLARRPRLLDLLACTPWLDREKPEELFARELGMRIRRLNPGDVAGLHRALRRYKYRELTRIAARDLLGKGPLAEITRELSALASCAFDAALPFLETALRLRHGAPEGAGTPGSGLCVIGMGKLGGRELNFSSDVDVLFVYGRDGRTAGGTGEAITHFQFYARLAEALCRAIGEITENGFVFRVDLNLRPEGRSGPLVNSLAAMQAYYEAWGRTWERAALLKARPVAGDLAVGGELLESLKPFVWRRSVDFSTVEEMRGMKAQIDRRAGMRGDDVKLGPGGIREIEFFAQSLQLLHGGKDARLRDGATLSALSRQLFAGLLTARDHDALADAYVFLRRTEHRLQMVAERQTHALPEDDAARARLAAAMGLPREAFERELLEHRAHVTAIFGDILGASGAAQKLPDAVLAVVVDPDASDEARIDALSRRGFREPHEALQNVLRLQRVRSLPFGQRGAPSPEAIRLLADTAAAPDPDRALFLLGELFSSIRSPAAQFALLAHYPATARLVTSLFGTSDFFSRSLMRHPELLDSLVRADVAATRKGRERMGAELAVRLARHEDLEDRLIAMRRFHNEEVLRIGLNDIAGELPLQGVAEELSDLADTLLGACLQLSFSEAQERFGVPRGPSGEEATFVVIGLGKLGGRELGYHSDLDLLFVYSDPGETDGGARGRASNGELFARVAQRLLSHLSVQLREGYLYRTDTRLRPSGNQGTLVVSAQAFAEHQRLRAQLWERQALVKARFVAGDEGFYRRLEEEVMWPAVFRPEVDAAALGTEILRMRERMERELAQESPEQYDPKLGRGGLVDVEFLAQFLQLVHGHRHPELRTPNTRAALAALREAGSLQADEAALLDRAYLFLRQLENRLRIVHDFNLRHLPRGGRSLELLARRLGYAGANPGAELLAEYEALTREVRAVLERRIGAVGKPPA